MQKSSSGLKVRFQCSIEGDIFCRALDSIKRITDSNTSINNVCNDIQRAGKSDFSKKYLIPIS